MEKLLASTPVGILASPAVAAISVRSLFIVGAVVRDLWAWSRLRHIPGPFICGFSTLWLVQKFLSGRANEDFKRLSEKYGKA